MNPDFLSTRNTKYASEQHDHIAPSVRLAQTSMESYGHFSGVTSFEASDRSAGRSRGMHTEADLLCWVRECWQHTSQDQVWTKLWKADVERAGMEYGLD